MVAATARGVLPIAQAIARRIGKLGAGSTAATRQAGRMHGMRMAGDRLMGERDFWSDLQRYGLPQDIGQAALRIGPDVGFATLYALTTPEATAGERAGMFAEDVAGQTLPALLGSGIAGAVARRMGMKPGAVSTLVNMTDMGLSMASPIAQNALGLRPAAQAYQKRMEAQMSADQQALLDQAYQEGLVASTPAVRGPDMAWGALTGQRPSPWAAWE